MKILHGREIIFKTINPFKSLAGQVLDPGKEATVVALLSGVMHTSNCFINGHAYSNKTVLLSAMVREAFFLKKLSAVTCSYSKY